MASRLLAFSDISCRFLKNPVLPSYMSTKSEILERVGNQIRKLRKAQGMRQEDLAKKIGVSRTSIIGYEKGYVAIPLDHLDKIAHIFGKPFAFFFETPKKTGFIRDDREAEFVSAWRRLGDISPDKQQDFTAFIQLMADRAEKKRGGDCGEIPDTGNRPFPDTGKKKTRKSGAAPA